MKQVSIFPLFMLFLWGMIFPTSVSAQLSFASAVTPNGLSYAKKDEYKFKDHLWFGAGLSLGFAGTSGASIFGIGISPMVGYKIVGPLSAGPRLSVLFTSEKYSGYKAFNLFDVELSLFARVRVFKGLFVQGEIGTVSDQQIVGNQLGQPVKNTLTRPAQYLGIGYNFTNGQGGGGQEIAIMYDFYVADDLYASQTPFQIRVAFTFGY